MEINKERSKRIKKLLSISLAVEIMLSAGATVNAEEFDSVREQIRYHNAQHEFEERIKNLPEELYDKEYDDYCDNGVLIVNDIEYPVKYLHLEYGYIGDIKKVYLKDYHNPKVDIITGETIDENYKRVRVMDLKISDVFYEYYHDTNEDKDLKEYIDHFEGGLNYMVPRTYFFNPEFNTDSKEKSR